MKTTAIVNGMSLIYDKGGRRRRDLETGGEIVVMESTPLNDEDTVSIMNLGYVYRGQSLDAKYGGIWVLY